MCASLAACGQWALLCCCLTALLATTATTFHLGFCVLREVKSSGATRDDGTTAKQWLASHANPVAVVVLVASSRLDMIAILRLKLCGRVIIDLPMEHRHFHFARHAGMYHYLIEDAPHALIGVAQLMLVNDEGGWIQNNFGMSEEWITGISTIVSLCSIVFGLVNKAVQLLVLEPDEEMVAQSTMSGRLSVLRGSVTRAVTGDDEGRNELEPAPLLDALAGSE